MSDDLRIPSIGGMPGGTPLVGDRGGRSDVQQKGQEGLPQFDEILKASLEPAVTENSSLVKSPLKFSAHASSRLKSRGIELGNEEMRKLSEAVDKAQSKGLDDTLILTKDAAFIVSVKNRTVVTAMDRTQLEGNVFTNIEGAVIV